jgi:hypothetical protein
VLAVGWSLVWLWLMSQTEQRLDAAAAAMRAKGWQVAWSARHAGGYPFRLDLDLTNLAVTDPSGWGLAAPMLKTEAYAFAPTHWVFFAPSGLVVTRPVGGALNVNGSALRGSASGWDKDVPAIALEGNDLTLTPAPSAAPASFTTIHNLQFYTRPGPDDQGAAYLQIEGGQPTPASWLDQLSAGKPVNLKTDVIFSRASAFHGPGWRASVTSWAHAGGTVQLGHLELVAGAQSFSGTSGGFAVDDAGLVVGQLQLNGGPAGHAQDLTLQFKDGATWLGPLKLQPAPKLF